LEIENWKLEETRYSSFVRELVRRHLGFFLLTTLAAVALRLFFILKFPAITDDSRLYADIAKNWFQHGLYGITDDANIIPTCVRLPGYPAFLGLIFTIFGPDHYRAALLVQMAVDIASCFVVADLARRVISMRAAKAAFLLAALCPFLANYSAAALTETLEIFVTALVLDFALAGMEALKQPRMLPWAGCGAAIGVTILLRPDGGLLLGAVELYLLWVLAKSMRGPLDLQRESTEMQAPRGLHDAPADRVRSARVVWAGMIVAVVALAPLVPWTLRNLHTMHRLEPLAPRYANEEEEFVPMGFNRWVKTWMADYVSVQEIYWNVPGEPVDPAKLPSRAFDSAEQRQRTLDLLAEYNRELHVSPELDAEFEALTRERIRAARFRYYVRLPLVRIADMWLRPRTELLAADPRWWEFNDDLKWSVVAVGFGLIDVGYVLAALGGLIRGRQMPWVGLLILYVLLRSLFLGTLENPEPRYTLECYPVVIVFAARLFVFSDPHAPAA
jgi:Dolichyl-phosphate-mannose-protein mannosyltransferase